PKATAKKAAPKKAAAIRLSDTQKSILKQVADTKAVGMLATKATAKTLSTLQAKKLIKKGKKEGEYFRYFITKLGEKQTPAAPAPAEPAPSPSA
ncbi:MAG: histidine biosynthesis protein HisIE, partial [Isosphaeraceae bacterium]